MDDHRQPFNQLSRLLDLHDLFYLETAPDERLPADEIHVRRFQGVMCRLGYYAGLQHGRLAEKTRAAIQKMARMENLRRRLHDSSWLDRRALQYLEAKTAEGQGCP
ncbi:MAG: putative peptidoglycan binding domain-containing protein [Thermaerobacterales bacterium]